MKKAIIVGAGPAGLTAAYELLERTDVIPVIIEMDKEYVGGIARTVNYKGNRIDIGGHRFFSKSDRVMDWWMNIMPLEELAQKAFSISYQNKTKEISETKKGPNPEVEDEVMLIRNRKSRIYYSKNFFDYPIKLNPDTIKKLGPVKMSKIGSSYLKSMAFPRKNEKNLEDFFINRFGVELYETFFKEYTEKVWGEKCSDISAEWGKQRIKGLSLMSALSNFVKEIFKSKNDDSISQKNKETSLIERFLYPKLGPGQMWEIVAKKVKEKGGEIYMHHRSGKVFTEGNQITGIEVINMATNETQVLKGDYYFSTMPIKELIQNLQTEVPKNVKEVSDGLMYRDFFTVGLLVEDLLVKDNTPQGQKLVSDNWIYIQEPGVEIGRLQIFNNWSPYLVKDKNKVWLGLEYFCYETDDIWKKSDAELIELGKFELDKIGILEKSRVVDGCVLRVPKTYPGYFGSYNRFEEIKTYINTFENLFLIGRNGMHKYNNQDHSMLTAMMAVDNISAGITDKSNLWEVNTEEEYHEEKK